MVKKNNPLDSQVSLKTWFVDNNLLEAEHSDSEFKKSMSWFKRHLGFVQIYTPKAGIHFIDQKEADKGLVEHVGTLAQTNKNKQIAALKLDARNTAIRIAVRANVLPKKPDRETREVFWQGEAGRKLYEYILILKYSQKPHLAPLNTKLKEIQIEPIFYSVLHDSEIVDFSHLQINNSGSSTVVSLNKKQLKKANDAQERLQGIKQSIGTNMNSVKLLQHESSSVQWPISDATLTNSRITSTIKRLKKEIDTNQDLIQEEFIVTPGEEPANE
jgi:hypothetical protein